MEFKIQINNEIYVSIKYISCNIWDILVLKIFCHLSAIHISLDILYFI